jgi:hypothetical protein
MFVGVRPSIRQVDVDSFCPLIMPAGRPPVADRGSLYAMAHMFYWDFRRLADGTTRYLFDKKKYIALEEQVWETNIELTPEQKHRAREAADEEIAQGRCRGEDREKRILEIENSQRSATQESLRLEAVEESKTIKKIPTEPGLIETLLRRNVTADEIRKVCKSAFMSRRVEVEPGRFKEIEVNAWPIPPGDPFPNYLSQFAEQYVSALNDPRFPSCDVSIRPTSRLKQFWFLSRALAAAVLGVSTRTALNLVGSLRPEETFEQSNYAKPKRRQTR